MVKKILYLSLLALVFLSGCSKPIDVVDIPTDVEKELVNLINQERKRNGVNELVLNPTLVKCAKSHSGDMAAHNKLTHDGSDGSTTFSRMEKFGYNYSYAGEDVAYAPNPTVVMQEWSNSPLHRDILLSPNYSQVGVATSSQYWTMDVGTPR